MDEVIPSSETGPRVTAAAIAANLRILSVRLDKNAPEQGVELHGRINQIVALFLEKHWRAPRRFVPIRALSYLLFPGPDDPAFAEDVQILTTQLERHLFGEGMEIKCLIGDVAGVTAIATASDAAFKEAHAEAVAPRPAKAQEEEQPPAAHLLPLSEREQQLLEQVRLFAGYDAPREAVLCYVASIGAGEPAAPALYEDVPRFAGVRVEVFEFAALQFVADKVAERIRVGGVSYCLAPLSYETLADRRRREAFLKAAATLPEAHRRFILPSVFGGPPGPSTNFLVEIVGAVRAWFPNVDWVATNCSIDLNPLKHAGIFAVTLAPPRSAWERKIELARLPAFVRRIAALRMRAGVAGLATLGELEEAIAARAHYLSGAAISAEMPDLRPRIDLTVAELPLATAA